MEQYRDEQDEIVQYLVVNKELKMSGPKLGAQIGHACTLATKKYQDEEIFDKWLENGQVKILLGGKEKDLLKLIDQGFIPVRDFGRTEIPPNSLTVVALPPMYKSEAKQYVKRLQLLKENKSE